MQLPESFIQSIKLKLNDSEYQEFLLALSQSAPTSIRVNPNKKPSPTMDNAVKWCPHGLYLSERPVFTLDPIFHAGAYYVQEASSMFIWHVLEQIGSQKQRFPFLIYQLHQVGTRHRQPLL